MQPFFSVIIPTFNRANFIARAIESVLAQTYGSWELIVIDDGSTDDTRSVVSRFSDERIKYLWQENAERSAARNRGIELAEGDHICFLDSDDYYLDFHLQTFYDHIQDSGSPEVFFFCDTLLKKNGELCELPFKPRSAQNGVEFVLLNLIGTPRCCFPREMVSNVRFNEEIRMGEDRDFLAKIFCKNPERKMVHIPVATQVYVFHPAQSVTITDNESYIENLKTAKYLLGAFGKHLSSRGKRYVAAKSYHCMMLHYLSVGRPDKALYWLLLIFLKDWTFIQLVDVPAWRTGTKKLFGIS